MVMEFLKYSSTSTVYMSLKIHYLIISVKWSENPCTPACSTSPVVNSTNNKWYTGSRDFCRQIAPAILAILHGFVLKRVKHIREVFHVKIKTDDNKAKVNIINLGLKKEQRLVICVLFIAITFCFTLVLSFNFSAEWK